MDIGFDFFLFIAFFIPGVFILYSLSLLFTPIRNLLGFGINNKENNNWILTFSLCILLGMMSSILRNTFIDPTFRIDFTSWKVFQGRSDWKSITYVEPNYSKLSKDNLEILKELKNEEKRPYQFYGNMLIALTCILICFLILCFQRKSKKAWGQFIGIVVAYLFTFWILYIGCRYSHYYYIFGIQEFNNK